MIDEIDKQILELLQEDGRLSNAAIGSEVGLSASSVYERIKKLENKGIITGYVAKVNPLALGKQITAFIRLTFSSTGENDFVARKQQFIDACIAEPDVLECHGVAGADCYLLKTCVASPMALEKLLERLRSHAVITGSVSSIVLSTAKETTKIVPS